MEQEVRIQKYLASLGVASRRKCEEYIQTGRIKVNGKIIEELGTKINPEVDIIELNGKRIEGHKPKLVYILINKPIGYVTTAKDQFGRDTVLDLIKEKDIRVVPVGRLDMYTSGALLLSNDGDFIQKVTHPSHEVEKTYTVTVRGIVTKEEKEKLESGVEIEGHRTARAKVKILRVDDEKNISRLQIVIHEGKNRQVRKMVEAVDKKVLALHRSKIGGIDVKNLLVGQYRYLSKEEIKALINKTN